MKKPLNADYPLLHQKRKEYEERLVEFYLLASLKLLEWKLIVATYLKVVMMNKEAWDDYDPEAQSEDIDVEKTGYFQKEDICVNLPNDNFKFITFWSFILPLLSICHTCFLKTSVTYDDANNR